MSTQLGSKIKDVFTYILVNIKVALAFVLTWGWSLTGSREAASIATAQTRSAKANLYETDQLQI